MRTADRLTAVSPMNMTHFHPAVAAWFSKSFESPTPAQAQAWPAIKAGQDVLVAAPTGSGKTLAAFLAAIDSLVRQGLEAPLGDETQIVYVSPLKALSNDIQRNLQAPLAGIRHELAEQGLPDVNIRTWVRTGDTPAAERQRMNRLPPHIVVTTPESLYILLGSESGRAMLKTTQTVIVDEIHALAPNKRGSHLSLSLERLRALCGGKLLKIGLSATQKPIEDVAHFLVGKCSPSSKCLIIDSGHYRERDLQLEMPASPLEAVMSAEVWNEIYDRLAGLIDDHRTTLIFVNTRRMAERVTRQLSDRLGANRVAAHHGSLAKEHRLDSEKRLKSGELSAMVATSSLELGIDIGEIDLVCQLGSPRSIASFLQRVGRSGHCVDGKPKGRLFPLSRDDLVECAALVDSAKRGELDQLVMPSQPLDVLAQQIVAEVNAQEWREDDLFVLVRGAWPYRKLTREEFNQVLRMLSEGFSTRRGRRGALIHRDEVNGFLRARRGARLTALTSGGTIPDNSDFQVLLEPENAVVGTVNEDFAVESLAGDIFQLGNTAYRILRVERGVVRVEDAHGAPPTIPFWLGETPGRSDELSRSVSRLRAELELRLKTHGQGQDALHWLVSELGLASAAAEQLVDYLRAAHAALGALPTQQTLIFERFFDEAGGMQLVIHSPYGNRINRAWGLALRKRFCRKFNFELQAAATEDNIVLSLTTAHSFELAEVARYLNSTSVREVLIQALLDAPMFATRWRWVASVALALPRFRGGKKVPAQIMRMVAEDLVGTIFPDQVACAENLVGEREVPDHPLVDQTISDCLTEAMDIDGLERLLVGLEQGKIQVVARDLTEPSPLAQEVLTARPYAYLDDAPLEERRTQAVMSRRWLDPDTASELGQLDAAAIARVRAEAWPDAANPDELHDALVWLGFLTKQEAASPPGWTDWLGELTKSRRVTKLRTPNAEYWIPAERLPEAQAIWPGATIKPSIAPPQRVERKWMPEEALIELVRGRLEGQGPVVLKDLASTFGLKPDSIAAALAALEVEGFALSGRFTPGTVDREWCERRLLARIHRYTVNRLRAEIEPVSARDYLRFLFEWQRIAPDTRMEGPQALNDTIEQLAGFEAPAAAWEEEILPARLKSYESSWLDDACFAGRVVWTRLSPANGKSKPSSRLLTPLRSTPISLMPRRDAALWTSLSRSSDSISLSTGASKVSGFICEHGASFFEEIVDGTHLLSTQVEAALAELVALGRLRSDSFDGLRMLLSTSRRKHRLNRRRHRGFEGAGRWVLAPIRGFNGNHTSGGAAARDNIEHVTRTLLRRYGVVFPRVLAREAAWLPKWRDLLRVYRKLEARGDIRGGRFVAGFSGEQFALPEAVGKLRAVRRQGSIGELVSLSGADPLNLAGILTPGPKLAALARNRILYRDGVPIAFLEGDVVRVFEASGAAKERVRMALFGQAEAASRDMTGRLPNGLVRLRLKGGIRPSTTAKQRSRTTA
jgi:ATP-dependent helicase Lhr and Lhr-like helicase